MRKLRLNKIASATRNARLAREVVVSPEVVAREGSVVAVRALERKSVYNEIEDCYGRMATVNEGDVIAGVLGERRALRGYSGIVPERIAPGDVLHLLNLGGVIGLCTSNHVEVGPPGRVEVLGQVLAFPYLGDRRGVPANILDHALPPADELELPSAKVVYVSGTCMNSGKTFAACEVIRGLSRRGRRVAAAKLTGVSLLRDTLKMEDVGAFRALNFNDAGAVSTRPEGVLPIARGLINALNRERPDCIVVELGDGLLGEYGVMEILKDPGLRALAGVHVVCANDPVAAWGAYRLFVEEIDARPTVLSGPATDNEVGKRFARERLGLPAINARTEGERLAAHVDEVLFGGAA